MLLKSGDFVCCVLMTIYFFFFLHLNNINKEEKTQNNFIPKIEGVDYCHFDDVPFICLQWLRKTLWFGA